MIKLKESEKLELKKSTSELKEAIISIAAILNKHKKGELYFGIKTDGKIIGQTINEKTIRDVSKSISDHIEPKIFPKINEITLENKKCIHVEFSGNEKPYYAYGRAYIRVGDEDKKLSSQELERLILKKNKDKLRWDEEICRGVVLKDIDREKVRWFVKEARKQRDLDLEEDLPVKEVLMRLKLLKSSKISKKFLGHQKSHSDFLVNGNFTNAAVLLFGKEPKFLQSEVKCIRFSGNEPVKPYIDFLTIEGSVFDLVDKAEDFIFRNIKKAIWLVPGQLQREEKYEYPSDAIREAIINAIVHRDYKSPSKVQVRIFDNRMEIWNPGLLPKGITIEDLKKEHRSIPRNPLLFKQLFWVKYVEDVGGGTLDMIKQCKEWGIPEPEFKFITGAFVVIFRLSPSLDKVALNERQLKAVNYVIKKGSINNKEYQKLNNITKRTATRDLTDLLKKNIFKMIGKGKRELKYTLLLGQNVPKMSQKMSQKEDDYEKPK